ncbi:MAG: hypothetical protein CMD16_02225 [Flavobacteriales bacterium]|nr:hypothetical protein [Flavobacteriales bacterium]
MKRILLSACVLLFATAIFAQQQKQQEVANMLGERITEKVVNTSTLVNPVVTPSNSASPTNIYSDDFSNPANWIIEHDLTSCDLDWQIGTYSCQGSYPINDIVSTTAANGYALIDSDFYGGATGGTEIEDCWLTMANPVDLNGYPYVVVEFESQYRSYNAEQTYIVVGVGDGSGNVTWPDLTPTTDISTMSNVFKCFDYSSGDQTTNPELVTVDISSALVGLSSVELSDIYIRFNWTGTWGYAWFVDDFVIAETPDNGLSSKNEVIGGYWVDYNNYVGTGLNTIIGLDYSHTPQSQLANHPFVFESILKNTGIATQSVVLHYDVTGAGSASGMSAAVDLVSQEEQAFSASPAFGDATTPIGSYNVDIWGEADSVGAGITITTLPPVTIPFDVTQYIYGKDLGSATQTSAYILGGAGDQNHITTRYEMYADEQLYSARAFIDDRSTVGSVIRAVIYEVDTTATSSVIILDESDPYVIQGLDLGSWIDIPFITPTTLINGYAYELGIAGFQHPTDTSYIGVNGPMMYAGEHSSFDELGLSTQSAGSPTWYYVTQCPMIRMNFDPSTISNINNLSQTGFNIYPNPSNGIFTISLDENKKYDIIVNNMLGQTVYSSSINTSSTIVDLTSFDKGIYTIELKNNNTTYTEKVVVD